MPTEWGYTPEGKLTQMEVKVIKFSDVATGQVRKNDLREHIGETLIVVGVKKGDADGLFIVEAYKSAEDAAADKDKLALTVGARNGESIANRMVRAQSKGFNAVSVTPKGAKSGILLE